MIAVKMPLDATNVMKVLIGAMFVMLISVDYILCDYENTWNFYYEQPCCGNTNGQHHLRHHKGNWCNFILYIGMSTYTELLSSVSVLEKYMNLI